MSLILDALRKADHDRKVEQGSPDINEMYIAPETKNTPSKIVVFGTLLAILILCILLIIKIFEAPPQPNEANTKPEENTSKITEKQNSERDTTSSSSHVNKTIRTYAQLSPSSNTESFPKTTVRPYQNLKPSEATSNENQTQKQVSSLYNKETPPNSNKEKIPAKTEIKVNKTARNSLLSYTNIPLIKELPLSAQEAIPTLMYSQHVYQERGEKYVVINGKRQNEGSSLAQGIKIKKILSDGVLLEKQQRTFRLMARSSWINF